MIIDPLLSYFLCGIDMLATAAKCFKQQQQDGHALEYVSENMKGDRELCTAAVAARNKTRQRNGKPHLADAEVDTWFREIGVPEAVRRDALTK